METAKRSGRPGFSAMVGFFKEDAKAKTSGRGRPVLLVEKTDRRYRNLKDRVTLDDLDLEIRDNLPEKASKGMSEKAEPGFWPSSAPLGYRRSAGPNGRKTIEPDPEVAPVVARLSEWYATGH